MSEVIIRLRCRMARTPIGDEEGRIIHEGLGDKRAILLAHHGQLVATSLPATG
jgi:hypothetical protein